MGGQAVKALIVAVAAALLMFAPMPGAAQTSDPQSDITQVLVDSLNGWNRGEIDRYLAAYSNLPELTIISGGATVRGIDQFRQAVAPAFAADAATRGIRTFEVMSFVPIDGNNAMIIIRAKNTASPAKPGTVSYLFRRGPFGWRVLIAHAS